MIAVFRTSVESTAQVAQLSDELSAACESPQAWNFDLQDCDHILRVDAENFEEVCAKCRAVLNAHGFMCEGLE